MDNGRIVGAVRDKLGVRIPSEFIDNFTFTAQRLIEKKIGKN